jgi:hypothetical protein
MHRYAGRLRGEPGNVHDEDDSSPSILIHPAMAADDRELMLWALANGWSVRVFDGHAQGSLWRDPARRRHLVYGAGPAPALPALSDELRIRIAQARAEALRPTPVPAD